MAGRPPGRPAEHPGAGARHRRRVGPRARAGRERAPLGPQRARGGGGLPAAHRGLRAHPRRGRDPGRPEPHLGDQHAPAPPAPADGPAPGARQVADHGPRPRAARNPGPEPPGDARQADRQRRPLGPRGRRRAARAGRDRDRRRADAGDQGRRRHDGRRRRRDPPAPAAGSARAREPAGDHLDTRVKVDMGTKRGKVTIEFSTLEDLERIYKIITE